MPRPLFVLPILAALGVVVWSGEGDQVKPGKLTKEEQAKLDRGVTLRFLGSGKVVDARRARMVALHVPAGSAPSPFLGPGPFSARFSGYIKMPLKATVSFQMVG